MYTPQTFGVALTMMIVTAFCWGSWANTYKGVKNYRFELFYWDYAIGIFLSALVYGHTLGSLRHDGTSLVENIHATDLSNVGWALLAGAIFNLANLLLVAGIDLAGLATAFPVSIGIALVVGVILSYLIQPAGNLVLLGAGVVCAFIAVILDGKAYGQLHAGKEVSRKSIVICVISGVLMGLWAPFSTRAMTHGNSLGPYAVVVFLTFGALLSCFIWNIYFMKKPLVGSPVAFGGFFTAPVSGHVLGLLGGAIWTTGTVLNLAASKYPGASVATSYAIGQSAPMVAAAWGIFVWKEFAGANVRAKAYLALMFVFYLLAILLVARAITVT
jgi:glucose uptake protein